MFGFPSATQRSCWDYDVLQLSGLLYLTGGMANPFSFLLIVPVTVSAATLPIERTCSWGRSHSAFRHSDLLETAATLAVQPEYRPSETVHRGHVGGGRLRMAFSALYAWRTASETRAMSKRWRKPR